MLWGRGYSLSLCCTACCWPVSTVDLVQPCSLSQQKLFSDYPHTGIKGLALHHFSDHIPNRVRPAASGTHAKIQGKIHWPPSCWWVGWLLLVRCLLLHYMCWAVGGAQGTIWNKPGEGCHGSRCTQFSEKRSADGVLALKYMFICSISVREEEAGESTQGPGSSPWQSASVLYVPGFLELLVCIIVYISHLWLR